MFLPRGSTIVRQRQRRVRGSIQKGIHTMFATDIVGLLECGYLATWELTPPELHRIKQLRGEVFSRELGWVGTDANCEERDEFDAGSVPIALLDEHSEIVGSLRLTRHDKPWMLDTVFRELDPCRIVVKCEDTAEVSRLLVVRKSRNIRLANGRHLCDLLYKATYLYCQLQSVRYLYMVTSNVVLRHLRQSGLPCLPLTPPYRMSDGVRAVVVRLDWGALAERPAVAAWYNSGWAGASCRDHQEIGGRLSSGGCCSAVREPDVYEPGPPGLVTDQGHESSTSPVHGRSDKRYAEGQSTVRSPSL